VGPVALPLSLITVRLEGQPGGSRDEKPTPRQYWPPLPSLRLLE